VQILEWYDELVRRARVGLRDQPGGVPPATTPRTVRRRLPLGIRKLSSGRTLLRMTQSPSRNIPFERFTARSIGLDCTSVSELRATGALRSCAAGLRSAPIPLHCCGFE